MGIGVGVLATIADTATYVRGGRNVKGVVHIQFVQSNSDFCTLLIAYVGKGVGGVRLCEEGQ